ncbi:hypothetical protein FX016_23115 [Cupriavidus gilardii]|nr:hypothetical protein FX016_23115 [Cupriavidus gilardii]
MKKSLLALLAAAGVLGCSTAQAQMSVRPNLHVTAVEVFCQNYQPFVSIAMPVASADSGRPGLLYVGMHDAGMSQAAFLTSAGWQPYQGGLFPVYSIVKGGLASTRLVLPLNPNLAGGGWKLYVGYGALSAEAEARVQQAVVATATAKAMNPKGAIAAVDPDHYRRTLVQTDMTQAGKFGYVDTGVENIPDMCRLDNSGGV